MTVCLLVTTDGRRDLLASTIASLEAVLAATGADTAVTRKVMVDDSGDAEYRRAVAAYFTDFELLTPAEERVGQGRMLAYTFDALATLDEEYVFLSEDDYWYRDLPLVELVELLDTYPHLLQVALLRQPWFRRERAAGSVYAAHPGAYTEVGDARGRVWCEQTRHWTWNPCLFRASLLRDGYIDGERHEKRFGERLLAANPDARFAYWGALDDPPRVEHRGHERAGTGY